MKVRVGGESGGLTDISSLFIPIASILFSRSVSCREPPVIYYQLKHGMSTLHVCFSLMPRKTAYHLTAYLLLPPLLLHRFNFFSVPRLNLADGLAKMIGPSKGVVWRGERLNA